MSRNVVTRPSDIAAPFWSFIAARYAKYVHCTASLKSDAGFETSMP